MISYYAQITHLISMTEVLHLGSILLTYLSQLSFQQFGSLMFYVLRSHSAIYEAPSLMNQVALHQFVLIVIMKLALTLFLLVMQQMITSQIDKPYSRMKANC